MQQKTKYQKSSKDLTPSHIQPLVDDAVAVQVANEWSEKPSESLREQKYPGKSKRERNRVRER